MLQQPELKKQFDAIIEEWQEKGFLQEVRNDIRTGGFYLTNFLIVRLDKHTTKYRLVINGAAEFDGQSLNDHLLPGPSRIADMYKILDQLRMGDFILGTDIESMFMKVRVEESDQKYLRLFYRKNKKDPTRPVELAF